MKSKLNKSIFLAVVSSALAFGATAVFAVEDIVASAREGCQSEIDTLCKDVTAGEGRILACLTSHEDKLSARCNYALYDATAQLERFAVAIKYVAAACEADRAKNCADVAVGDGRIATCLNQHKATLAATCTQAMKDTQMQVQ